MGDPIVTIGDPDMTMGGGAETFAQTATGGDYKGKTLEVQAKERGYQIVRTADELTGVTKADQDAPLLGLFGGDVREIRIQPNLTKMTSYGFTLTQLADAARGALSLRGAGFVDLAHQRVLIQTPVPAPDTNAISGAVLGIRGNIPITIGDIAVVAEAPALRAGDALIMGRPGVLLVGIPRDHAHGIAVSGNAVRLD